MRNMVIAGLLIAAAGCAGTTDPDGVDGASSSLASALKTPIQVTLRNGQERSVEGTLLRLSFLRVVEDSRCPIDAVCVWMGDGVAEVGVTAGSGPTFPLRLHTALDPRSAEATGVRVTLLELSPAPRAATPTRAEDYAVRLQVEAVAR